MSSTIRNRHVSYFFLLPLASKVEKKKVRWADEPRHQAPTSEGTVFCLHTPYKIADDFRLKREKKKHNRVGCEEKSNRPFPSCLLPLFQNESICETFSYEKMCLLGMKTIVRVKHIVIRMTSYGDSFSH